MREDHRAALGRPATLGDVAKASGVSVPTASRILNGGVRGAASGRPELRERVTSAAARLGYSPITAAQAVKGARARTVALLVSDVHDVGSAGLLAGAIQTAEDRGISLSVRATYDDAARELALLRAIRGERHRAVVLATSRTTDVHREAALDAELQQMRIYGTRVVLVGENSLGYDTVTVDNRDAAADFAIALAAGGARDFAVVTGPAHQVTARDRAEGFLFGLRTAGISVSASLVVHSEFSRRGGYVATTGILDSISRLDVVAAMSDAMAVGAIAALRNAGVDVPGEVRVTGFDGISVLSDVLPWFDTVDVPLEALGVAAMQLALGDEPDPQRVDLRAVTHMARVRVDDAGSPPAV